MNTKNFKVIQNEYLTIMQKLARYFVMFFLVYMASRFNHIEIKESLMIAMIASIIFGFIDLYYPSVKIIEVNKST